MVGMTWSAGQAQSQMDVWSFAGGALDPATYEGNYRPASLMPNADADNGATIGLAGLTSGGLGSALFPDGYGGLYTFFSTSTTFTLQTSNVLENVQIISVSFTAGGGINFDEGTLVLNYNLANPALASSSFSILPGETVETPIGPMTLDVYTWTWDVSTLGASSQFSTSWSAGTHSFFGEFTATQSIPEPSSSIFAAAAFLFLMLLNQRRKSRGTLLCSR